MIDPLEKINEEIEEFEEFVDDFGENSYFNGIDRKMKEILEGKLTPDRNHFCTTVDNEFPPAAEILHVLDSLEEVPVESCLQPLTNNQSTVNPLASTKSGPIDYSAWEKISDDDYLLKDVSSKLPPAPTKSAILSNPLPAKKLPKQMQIVQDHVAELRVRGNSLFSQGNYQNAMALYSECLEISQQPPEDLEPRDKSGGAFSFLDKLLKPMPIPIDPTLFLNRALCNFKISSYEDALKDCNSALALDPLNVKAFYRQSQSFRALDRFQEAHTALANCKDLLENNTDNQKIVSLGAVVEQLEQMRYIVQDEKLANTEAQSLKEDPSYEVMKHLLDDCYKYFQSDNELKSKASSEIMTKLLASHQSMQHAFRLLDGFKMLTEGSIVPSEPWARVITSACKNVNENLRIVAGKTDPILVLLKKCTNGNVIGKVLGLLLEFETSRQSFERSPSWNTCLSSKILDYFPLFDKDSKSQFLGWLADVASKPLFDSLEKKGFPYSWVISIVLVNMNLHPERNITILFEMSLRPSCRESLKIASTQILNTLSNWIVQDNIHHPNEMLNDFLSTIYNIVSLLDSKMALDMMIVDKFVVFLCKSNLDRSLKLLGKLSQFLKPENIKTLFNRLDWSKGIDSLSLDVDIERDTIGDWSQLFAVVLKSESHNSHALSGAIVPLMDLLKKLMDDRYSRIIGNVSLCLIEFCSSGKFLIA
jgi:tetratricopeptide (TPR) repeat protein